MKISNLISIALLATSLIPIGSFAQDVSKDPSKEVPGGAGNVVKTKNDATTLADYFYEASFEPLYISKELRAEVKDLANIATTMGLSFGDDFWDCMILDEPGCQGPHTEFRSVKKLPVDIVMKIKDVRGILTAVQPFGYTPGTIVDGGSPTWIDSSIFSQFDLTDQAIALVHERFWAKFGLKMDYNYLTWYTKTLKMLRDVEAGKHQYDQSTHDALMKYGYYAYRMITGDNSTVINYHDYRLVNNGKCVMFGPKIEGTLEQVLIQDKTTSDQTCYGFYRFVYPINLQNIEAGNSVVLDVEKRALLPFAISVHGKDNLVTLKNMDQHPEFVSQIKKDAASYSISIIVEGNKNKSEFNFTGPSSPLHSGVDFNLHYSIDVNGNHNSVDGSSNLLQKHGAEVTVPDYTAYEIDLSSSAKIRGDENTVSLSDGFSIDISGSGNQAFDQQINISTRQWYTTSGEFLIKLASFKSNIKLVGEHNVVTAIGAGTTLAIEGSNNSAKEIKAITSVIDNEAGRRPWTAYCYYDDVDLQMNVNIDGDNNTVQNPKKSIQIHGNNHKKIGKK